jgi:DNA polymerase-3 subunit delta
MQLQQLLPFFASDPIPSILLIFGEEDFLVDSAYSQVVEFIKKKEIDEFDVTIVNGADVTEDFIVSTCLSYPFISSQKVVVVKHFELVSLQPISKKKNDPTPALLSYLNNPNPSTILILFSNEKKLWGVSKSQRSKKEVRIPYPYQQIIDSFHWIEFQKIAESSLPKWLSETSKEFHFELLPEASEGLLFQIGTNVRELYNEMMKISTFTKGKKTVTYEDVVDIVGMSREYSVFELMKAFNERNSAKACDIIMHLLEHDKIELLIVGSLTRSLLQLWSLKEATMEQRPLAEQLELSGINRYFYEEYRAAANKYTLAEIDQMILDITDIDTKLKSTTIDSRIMFLEFFSKHLSTQTS